MAQSDFYGYLFQSDKKPTKILDALLRGIATYIVRPPNAKAQSALATNYRSRLMCLQTESVGNKEEKCLTPAKLASFYKAVGGNYDCAATPPSFYLSSQG
jgi:hypothetical protein